VLDGDKVMAGRALQPAQLQALTTDPHPAHSLK